MSCYLAPEIMDIVRAVKFVCSESNDFQAVRILINSDISQVVNLMQTIE